MVGSSLRALRLVIAAAVLAIASRAHSGTGAWTSGGPYRGDVLALAIDPATPSTLYVGTGGGVFKSTNSGGTWAPVNTGLPDSPIPVLAIDPSTPSVLYAGPAEGGIFKSTDSGGTWVALDTGLASNDDLSALVIDPATPSTLYAGTYYRGVFKSADSGSTWAPANAGLATGRPYIYALAIDPTNPTTLYAGAVDDGVFKSTNGGGTWTAANTGLTFSYLWTLAVAPSTPSTLYAATTDGVFRSSDAGGTWTAASTSLPGFRVSVLAIDPTTPSTLYAGTEGGMFNAGAEGGVFKSTDSGATWANASLPTGPPYAGAHALAIDRTSPATLYAGTNGAGIFKSTNSGVTWANAGLTNLTRLPINALTLDPTTPSTLFAGTYGGGVLKSTNAGGRWTLADTGITDFNVTALVISPASPATVYAGGFSGVFKSTDAGATWSAANAGLTNPYIVSLAIDPLTPSTLYAGTDGGGGIFKSTDAGATWAPVNSGLPHSVAHFDPQLIIYPPSHPVNALAIDPKTPSTLYTGVGNGGVFKSTDAGGTWAAANTGLTSGVSALAIDPVTPSTLYAASFGAFKSTDSGATWFSTGLLGYVVTDLAVHPAVPTTLYAGTLYDGVFTSTDSGATWIAVNRGLVGLGHRNVQALALDPGGATTVYAGLWNGVWQSTPPTEARSDLTVTLSDAPDPVTGTTPLTYTLSVVNGGPDPASSLSVSLTLPAGVAFGSVGGAGWVCVESGGVVTCTRPDLAVGPAPPISVLVTPGPAAAVLVSSASVTAREVDPNPANNADSETTTVNPALVWFGTRTKTVVAASGPFVSNTDVTYTITLTNSGTQAQGDNPGHEFLDVLPTSLTLVSANPTSGTVVSDLPGNRVSWDGSLPSGGSVTITIQATIKPTVVGTNIANQGTINYDADGNGVNEAVTLTDDPATPGANDPTTFVVVPPPMALFTLPPCRLLDTRDADGTFGGPALLANDFRVLPLFDRCGIPPTARALSVNLTVTAPAAAGNLRLYPARSPLPNASSINYTTGQTRANNAVISLDEFGQLAVFCAQASGTTHFILDVNGYFE